MEVGHSLFRLWNKTPDIAAFTCHAGFTGRTNSQSMLYRQFLLGMSYWSTNSSRFKILFVAPGYKAVLLDLINYTSCFPRQSMGTLQRDIFLT